MANITTFTSLSSVLRGAGRNQTAYPTRNSSEVGDGHPYQSIVQKEDVQAGHRPFLNMRVGAILPKQSTPP
ncbi:hypothetical protein TNCV_2376081 [Trichonephila clavipes]|nr:hypothetical protein TNCV_2376081 [Trichonephila clavipes]